MMKRIVSFLFMGVVGLQAFSQNYVIGKSENLGPKINSKCYDYRPKLTADGQNLYFSRIICMEDEVMQFEGLLMHSKALANGDWDEATVVHADFNTLQNSPYLYSVTPDNNQMLLTLKAKKEGTRVLCKALRTEKGWEIKDTIDLGFEIPAINSTFCLSDNGRILLFSYVPEKKDPLFKGGKDLYVSFLQTNNKWTKPKNLGDRINTPNIDLNPFLASDNKTLYFCSKREDSYGQNDIYMSRRKDESWQNWTEPLNLGEQINDENWNDGFFIPAIGDYAYFNSENNSIGQGDIFRVKIKEKIKPEKVVLVQSKVLDKIGNPLGGALVHYENLETGEIVGTAYSDPKTGEFQISLPFGYKYGIYAEAKAGEYAVTSNLDLSGDSSQIIVKDSLKMQAIEKGATILLNNIFFATNKSTLNKESYAELNRLAEILKKNKDLKIRIEGHTDDVGNDETNMKLSKARALAVYQYLISKTVKKEQLTVKAFGETKPLKDNSTEEGRRQNRRVEFTILEK